METLETIEYKGYTINIHQDLNPIDPIDDFEWMGTMYCSHKRYSLGHQQFSDGADAIYQAIQDVHPDFQKVHLHYEDMEPHEFYNMYWDYLQRYAIALPVYMYDHSGITISTHPFSCKWDSGQIGFIFIDKAKLRKEMDWNVISGRRNEKALDILRSEVKTYDDYLTGNVYGYTIDDIDDSCWGFFGSDWDKNGLTEYAYNVIDCEIAAIENERAEAQQLEIGEMAW